MIRAVEERVTLIQDIDRATSGHGVRNSCHADDKRGPGKIRLSMGGYF